MNQARYDLQRRIDRLKEDRRAAYNTAERCMQEIERLREQREASQLTVHEITIDIEKLQRKLAAMEQERVQEHLDLPPGSA